MRGNHERAGRARGEVWNTEPSGKLPLNVPSGVATFGHLTVEQLSDVIVATGLVENEESVRKQSKDQLLEFIGVEASRSISRGKMDDLIVEVKRTVD